MSNEVILTCAVSGGHNNQGKHPDYPITPEHIARDCIDAAKAGAAIVHIHVRDPGTGMRSGDPALFREVVERIRDSGSDVLINLTPAAELRNETIIAAAGADRALCSEPIGHPLEYGPRVIVEPAHEPRIEHEVDSDIAQKLLELLEVTARLGIQMLAQ